MLTDRLYSQRYTKDRSDSTITDLSDFMRLVYQRISITTSEFKEVTSG